MNVCTIGVYEYLYISCILGTVLWIDKLKWENADRWKNSQTRPITIANVIQGYSKVQDNFGMYWVHRAGHMVRTYKILSLFLTFIFIISYKR